MEKLLLVLRILNVFRELLKDTNSDGVPDIFQTTEELDEKGGDDNALS